MVLDYMKTSGKITPDVQMKAEYYINLGYQRLLGFEVSGGGFSLYGRSPASLWLSAYGLMEMNDMNKVYPIDEKIIDRTTKWLLANQKGDGSWNSNLRETAITAWALSDTGYKGEELKKAVTYIKANMKSEVDLYTLALIANLLVYCEPDGGDTKNVLKLIYDKRSEDKNGVFWTSEKTLTYSYGITASIETTALVTQAFIKSGSYVDVTQSALQYLASCKDTFGTWHSTQATVLTLKTLVLSMKTDTAKDSKGSIKVIAGGQEAGKIEIDPAQGDVVKILDLKGYARNGKVELIPEGNVKCMYQVIYSYYLPWQSVSRETQNVPPLNISIEYDRTELKRNDLIHARVSVKNTSAKPGETVIIDLGVPPGFDVLTEDFDNLVKEKMIDRYETTGRQIIVYLDKVEPGDVFTFSYGLRAKFPLKVTAPVSEVYEYYNSNTKGYSVPEKLRVK